MGEVGTDRRAPLDTEQIISSEMTLSIAKLQLMVLDHHGPTEHEFLREGVFWMDLCLTPRRPMATARYVNRWSEHRLSELGSLIALPPSERLHLRSAGGKHA